jgi:zinc transporter 2
MIRKKDNKKVHDSHDHKHDDHDNKHDHDHDHDHDHKHDDHNHDHKHDDHNHDHGAHDDHNHDHKHDDHNHDHGAHDHKHDDHDHHDHDHDHGHDHDDHDPEFDEEAKHHENLNIRAAFIHVIGDMIQSIGVIIAAVIIKFLPDWAIVDPICTFIFSVIVLFTTLPIMTNLIKILMEGTPMGVNLTKMTADLKKVPGAEDVHDLHVWALSAGKSAMSAHITSSTPMITLKKATRLLNTKYKIFHTTIQIEHSDISTKYQCRSELL